MSRQRILKLGPIEFGKRGSAAHIRVHGFWIGLRRQVVSISPRMTKLELSFTFYNERRHQ